jgi:hypothetical protein
MVNSILNILILKALLKSKNIFSQLPLEVKNLMKNYKIINATEHLDEYFEANDAKISPNSIPLVDLQGKIGRKGYLTFIDHKTMESMSVWAVQNNRVLCLYSDESNLTIKKLIRSS